MKWIYTWNNNLKFPATDIISYKLNNDFINIKITQQTKGSPKWNQYIGQARYKSCFFPAICI